MMTLQDVTIDVGPIVWADKSGKQLVVFKAESKADHAQLVAYMVEGSEGEWFYQSYLYIDLPRGGYAKTMDSIKMQAIDWAENRHWLATRLENLSR